MASVVKTGKLPSIFVCVCACIVEGCCLCVRLCVYMCGMICMRDVYSVCVVLV